MAGLSPHIWSNLCTRHIRDKLTPLGHQYGQICGVTVEVDFRGGQTAAKYSHDSGSCRPRSVAGSPRRTTESGRGRFCAWITPAPAAAVPHAYRRRATAVAGSPRSDAGARHTRNRCAGCGRRNGHTRHPVTARLRHTPEPIRRLDTTRPACHLAPRHGFAAPNGIAPGERPPQQRSLAFRHTRTDYDRSNVVRAPREC